MTSKFVVLIALCLSVGAAPPPPPGLYAQSAPALQRINPYEFYLENPEVANYYSQPQQKQAASNNANGVPSRLETLEPDSEVELIPGAQQPQQPPQQNPVAPNLPGLIPGQRVFIVHMPVPGYRPGTIGGYQPVYIVAAAPQGNGAFSPNALNGYQNTVLLDPSGQVVSPLLYPRAPGPAGPGYLLAPQFQALKAPGNLAYQEHHLAYQPAPLSSQGQRPVQLAQLASLQHGNAANSPRSAGNVPSNNLEPKRLAPSRESDEEKQTEEPRRNVRPAHTQPVKP
ncbi:hypothetical protein ACJJTC_005473 [Scirpophaga incertulas]